MPPNVVSNAERQAEPKQAASGFYSANRVQDGTRFGRNASRGATRLRSSDAPRLRCRPMSFPTPNAEPSQNKLRAGSIRLTVSKIERGLVEMRVAERHAYVAQTLRD